METINDTLSFEDIQVYDNMLIDSVAEAAFVDGPQIAGFINKERPELTERFIHTFLEWEKHPEFDRHSTEGWTLSYVSSSRDISSLISTIEVDTFQEAKIIAKKKISRYLGRQVHFEQDNQVKDDLFMVINNGVYWGMAELRKAGVK